MKPLNKERRSSKATTSWIFIKPTTYNTKNLRRHSVQQAMPISSILQPPPEPKGEKLFKNSKVSFNPDEIDLIKTSPFKTLTKKEILIEKLNQDAQYNSKSTNFSTKENKSNPKEKKHVIKTAASTPQFQSLFDFNNSKDQKTNKDILELDQRFNVQHPPDNFTKICPEEEISLISPRDSGCEEKLEQFSTSPQPEYDYSSEIAGAIIRNNVNNAIAQNLYHNSLYVHPFHNNTDNNNSSKYYYSPGQKRLFKINEKTILHYQENAYNLSKTRSERIKKLDPIFPS